MTDLAGVEVGRLPDDPIELRRLASGLCVHPAMSHSYGVTADDRHESEPNLRPVSAIVSALRARRDESLGASRGPTDRVVGTCRTFTVLFVALLRAVGVPARARCGHAGYFERDRWIDHWVAEWWSDDRGRWVRADAQLDEGQLGWFAIDWDPSDVPPGVFLTGGECWQAIRRGEVDGRRCGILDMWGAWFVRGNVVRDLAALNKIELLPWDGWGITEDLSAAGSPDDDAYIDLLADVCASDDLARIRAAYDDDRVRVPDIITSFLPTGPVQVRLA
jgi:hypothetical protein